MSVHGKSGTRESSLKLALAFCVADLILMGFAAYRSNSVTIMGDLLKEATDTLAVLAAFYTIRAVRRSVSHQFSYGIGKLENLVSIWIGVITLGCAIFVTLRAVHHLNNPQVPAGTEVGIAIFALYTGICFYIWARTKRAMGKHSSAIMESQAKLWFSHECDACGESFRCIPQGCPAPEDCFAPPDNSEGCACVGVRDTWWCSNACYFEG